MVPATPRALLREERYPFNWGSGRGGVHLSQVEMRGRIILCIKK